MPRSAIDVAIIGGGPAGAAAALTLARYTQRRCALFEASAYDRPRIGENVSPAILPLLDYLGVAPPDVPGEMIPCYGAEAHWGSDSPNASASIFNHAGAGWMLDRCAFDARLATAARHAGVALATETALVAAEPGKSGWRLEFRDRRGATERVIARQVIDASGRRAVFARKAAARRREDDRLVALIAYGQRPDGEATAQALRLVSMPHGWWYMATLPAGRLVLALMTDADLVRAGGDSLAQAFEHGIMATPPLREHLTGVAFGGVGSWRANGSLLSSPVGPGWVAAGDAAASFDPLSSLGIGHALSSGIQSARLVHARLDGDESPAAVYAEDIARNHARYRARLAEFYSAERRWPDAPFWRSRHRPGALPYSSGTARSPAA